MNSSFRRNAFQTDTALILLGYIWRILVLPRTGRELLGGQPYRHRIPEGPLLLLAQTYKGITTKQQLD